MSQSQIGAPDFPGDLRVSLREPLDVGFVDDGLTERSPRGAVIVPIEIRAYHDRAEHVGRTVGLAFSTRIAELVREYRRIPVDQAINRLGIGIGKELGGFTADAVLRIPRAV